MNLIFRGSGSGRRRPSPATGRRSRIDRATCIVVVASAVLSVSSMAAAETYNVVIGKVGTNGSDAHANEAGQVVAVSHGGCSSGTIALTAADPERSCGYYGDADGNAVGVGLLGAESEGFVAVTDSGSAEAGCYDVGWWIGCLTGQGAALSALGTAHGTLAASGTGDAYADESYFLYVGPAMPRVAVSGTGNATGSDLAVSGFGNSSSPNVALGTGPSSGGVLAVSATDNATGGIAVSPLHNANGNVAVSGGGDASGGTASLTAAGDPGSPSLVGVGVLQPKLTAGGTTVDLSSTGDGEAAEALALTAIVPVPDSPHTILAGGMELVATANPSPPPTPSPPPLPWTGVPTVGGATVTAQDASNKRLPSCRNITYRGNAGAIYVQVGDGGYLQWGIYMYQPEENNGRWWVDVYVNGKRKDKKDQLYAPHGSLPPSTARSGSVFHIKADLRSNSMRRYQSVPNECRIP